MSWVIDLFRRGIGFVQENPQIAYTLFLSILIPVAFLFMSERFLGIAKENQNRLERGRIGALGDAFAILAADRIGDAEYLSAKMAELLEQNPSLVSIRIIRDPLAEGDPIVHASSDTSEIGKPYPIDSAYGFFVPLALNEPKQSFAMQIEVDGERRWRAMRALPFASSSMLLVTEVSMVEADQEAGRAIKNAYLTLIPVIGLILILLARHARIIDYASLYQRLAEVDRMKDDFVSMAAHELRAPLTVIRGYVEMAQDENLPAEERKRSLERIDASARQLNTLVGDILDVARLQEGRMSFTMERIDPSAIVVEVVNAFMLPAKEKGISLSYEAKPLPEILLDGTRFRQVMTNIIGNAVKYTMHGSVTVSAESDGVEVVFRVSDTGIGISAEDQKKLFSKFYRVKNSETQDIPGTGLGLWITREIVREMNGSISVESIKGKGTDFILRFPIPPAV